VKRVNFVPSAVQRCASFCLRTSIQTSVDGVSTSQIFRCLSVKRTLKNKEYKILSVKVTLKQASRLRSRHLDPALIEANRQLDQFVAEELKCVDC
jgi:hypothetical protein